VSAPAALVKNETPVLSIEALKGRDNHAFSPNVSSLMPQSLAQIHVHLVFSTAERAPCIDSSVHARLHAYLAGTFQAIGCPAIVIGGMPDHVHALFRLSRTVTLADAVKAAKVESSKWMKEDGGVAEFAWQGGYGAFSVSASQVETVRHYIEHQAEHHQTRSFQDEFRALLEKYQVTYNEACVWDRGGGPLSRPFRAWGFKPGVFPFSQGCVAFAPGPGLCCLAPLALLKWFSARFSYGPFVCSHIGLNFDHPLANRSASMKIEGIGTSTSLLPAPSCVSSMPYA
jgi:REP element-mobilizing transposase RayT